jgi:hypothetical protein
VFRLSRVKRVATAASLVAVFCMGGALTATKASAATTTTKIYHKGTSYVMTVQPSNSDGRLKNHVYMWEDHNWSTQRWDEGYDSTRGVYWFKSQYNGYCLNVPGYSRSTGVQLIVYPCGNDNNERFVKTYWVDIHAWEISVYYDQALDLFGRAGNGRWVMTAAASNFHTDGNMHWDFANP